MGNRDTQEPRTESAVRLKYLVCPTFTYHRGRQVSVWSLQRSFFCQKQVSVRLFDLDSPIDVEDLLKN